MGRTAKKTVSAETKPVEKTPYQILDVPETAAFDAIRKAYLRKVRLSPPERDPEGFKQVRRAYALLQDSAKRKKFDLSLFKTSSGLGIDVQAVPDVRDLFKERILQLLVASSDFNTEDFQAHFHDIDKEIEKLW